MSTSKPIPLRCQSRSPFLLSASLGWFVDASPLRSTEDQKTIVHKSLLALARYFDCAAILRQCEAVQADESRVG